MAKILKNMRILVTGGAGFLGSHLVDRLMSEGNEVICLDNFFTGRRENVAHHLESDRFQLVDHDVCEPMDFEVDRIFNLACPASPPHYQADPIHTAKTSFLGALHVLELAKRCGARVFQASTSEIYGDPEIHPQPESYRGCVNPIGIRSCYDEGKRIGETLFSDYHRVHGVETRIVRIFNTYGPRMLASDGRVVSNFIVQALKGEDLTIYGEGHQTRSFCFVDDLIEGFMRLMEHPDQVTPVNIGNSGEFTMLELAEKVIGLTGSGSQISFHELPLDDPRQRKPDISLAREVLGWEPTILLDEGLQKTISYFRDSLV